MTQTETMMSPDQIIRRGIAVVTGAGTGLGRPLSAELAEKGMFVVGLGRHEKSLQETASLIGPERFSFKVVDVAEPSQVITTFEDIAAEFGPVTILINNAAVYPRRDFLDETPESFMQSVNVNLGGVVACTHAVLGHMTVTGVGRILNVATFADIAPMPASSAYSVSKGAARILTRSLVADLSDRFPDIVISDWMPGALDTRMGISDGLDPKTSARWGAELALWHNPSLTGSTFERDREILPPRSLKRRVLDKVLLRKGPVPRSLG